MLRVSSRWKETHHRLPAPWDCKFRFSASAPAGRSMRHLPHLHANRRTPADAPNYILGYATGNDFTARDLQSRSTQWMLDKSLDGSAPVGPWLVTADLAAGDNLKIECRVNGEVRQSSNTSDMVFNCKQLVSYISKYMTLKPGDIIVTSIEKLGELTFTLT